MEIQFAKWGNSVALRVPSKVAESLGIIPGSVASLDLKRDKLIITPRQHTYRLDDLLADITTKNLHQEIPRGLPKVLRWSTDGLHSRPRPHYLDRFRPSGGSRASPPSTGTGSFAKGLQSQNVVMRVVPTDEPYCVTRRLPASVELTVSKGPSNAARCQ